MEQTALLDVRDESSKGRVAIVIVHGVGKQGRYQTLDKFVRGFCGALVDRELDRDTRRVTLAGGGSHSYVSITATDGAPLVAHPDAETVDCFEAYWQSKVRGVARAKGVGLWLVNTAMAPLRRWAQVEPGQPSFGALMWRMFADFLRLLAVPFLVLAAIVGVVALNGQFGAFSDTGKVGAVDALGAMAETVGLLAIFLMIRGGIWNGLLRRKPGRVGQPERQTSKPQRWWGLASAFYVALICLAFAVAVRWAGSPYLLSAEIRPLVISAVLAFVVWRVSSLLTEVVGDAAVYLTDDPESKGSTTRLAVRAAVQDLVTDLASSRRYDRVHIVAHSLGTVIAYDMLNELRVLATGDVDTDMASIEQLIGLHRANRAYAKIGTFVTLASPLDFVASYFRTRVSPERTVRREILHFRHGLRVRVPGISGSSDDRLSGDGEYLPGPPHLYWLNICARGDVIGEYLKTYEIDSPHHVGTWKDYLRPVAVHEGMWKSDEVYKIIVGRLAYASRAEAVDAVGDAESSVGATALAVES